MRTHPHTLGLRYSPRYTPLEIALLDRLSWLAFGLGATMAASGAFTLAFQASGIGFVGQSVLALIVGTALTLGGFALAGRVRNARFQLYTRPHLATSGRDARQPRLGLPQPPMRALPPTR